MESALALASVRGGKEMFEVAIIMLTVVYVFLWGVIGYEMWRIVSKELQ